MSPRLLPTLSIAGLATLLLAAGAKTALTHEQRLDAFREKAEAQRRSAGLPEKVLQERYGTPELTLVRKGGPDAIPEVKPGQVADVEARFQAAPGALVQLACDAVEVLSEEVKEGKPGVYRAKVKVRPGALPDSCALAVHQPLTVRSVYETAFQVGGRYTWELTLANGVRTRLDVAPDAESGAALGGTAVWTKGGKELGRRKVRLDGAGGSWRGAFEAEEEDDARRMEVARAAANDPEQKKAVEKLEALSKKMQAECEKLPVEKLGPCLGKYFPEMEKLQAPLMAKGDAVQKQMSGMGVGCGELSLEVAAGGKVTGSATGCGEEGEAIELQGRVVAADVP
jgi:hypothetical protein